MFYSVFVLGKKGPLARVWLAAHWDKKISKAQILETDICESVDSILQPRIKLSLRTSSHLLLGIVRIYARKTQYLLQDCQDAVFRIKTAFRTEGIDLLDIKTEAAASTITLPAFDFDNIELMIQPEFINTEPIVSANIRNITLPEELGSMVMDDPLGLNAIRDISDVDSIGRGSIVPLIDQENVSESSSSQLISSSFDSFDIPAVDDGFGGQPGIGFNSNARDFLATPQPNDASLFSNASNQQNGNSVAPMDVDEDEILAADLLRPSSPAPMADKSVVFSGSQEKSFAAPTSASIVSTSFLGDDHFNNTNIIEPSIDAQPAMVEDERSFAIIANDTTMNGTMNGTQASLNTLRLEPIDSQLEKLLERPRRRKRKIGVHIDQVKTLTRQQFKAQLADNSDITTNLELAPPTKTLMQWKVTGLADKLLALPERTITSKVLSQYYVRNLVTSRVDQVEDDSVEEEQNDENVPSGEDQSTVQQPDPALLDESQGEMRHSNGRQLGDSIQNVMPQIDSDELVTSRIDDSHANQPIDEQIGNIDDVLLGHEESLGTPRRGSTLHSIENANYHNGSIPLLDRSSIQNSLNQLPVDDFSMPNNMSMPGPSSPIPERKKRKSEDKENMMSAKKRRPDKKRLQEKQVQNQEYHKGEAGQIEIASGDRVMAGESDDQFEERVRTKKAILLLTNMAGELNETGEVHFSSLTKDNKRKEAAQKFYSLLVLKKQMAVELSQDLETPYSELVIKKGVKFDQHYATSHQI